MTPQLLSSAIARVMSLDARAEVGAELPAGDIFNRPDGNVLVFVDGLRPQGNEGRGGGREDMFAWCIIRRDCGAYVCILWSSTVHCVAYFCSAQRQRSFCSSVFVLVLSGLFFTVFPRFFVYIFSRVHRASYHTLCCRWCSCCVLHCENKCKPAKSPHLLLRYVPSWKNYTTQRRLQRVIDSWVCGNKYVGTIIVAVESACWWSRASYRKAVQLCAWHFVKSTHAP